MKIGARSNQGGQQRGQDCGVQSRKALHASSFKVEDLDKDAVRWKMDNEGLVAEDINSLPAMAPHVAPRTFL